MKTMALIFSILAQMSGTAYSETKMTVPDFNARDLNGQQIRLSTLLSDGPVVLDFWATYCKPCLKAMPELEKIQEEFKDRGVTILGVNEDGPRGMAKVKPFLRRLKVTYRVILDADGGLMRRFNVTGCPSVVIVSAEGDAVFRRTGYRPGDAADIRQALLDLVGPKPAESTNSG